MGSITPEERARIIRTAEAFLEAERAGGRAPQGVLGSALGILLRRCDPPYSRAKHGKLSSLLCRSPESTVLIWGHTAEGHPRFGLRRWGLVRGVADQEPAKGAMHPPGSRPFRGVVAASAHGSAENSGNRSHRPAAPADSIQAPPPPPQPPANPVMSQRAPGPLPAISQGAAHDARKECHVPTHRRSCYRCTKCAMALLILPKAERPAIKGTSAQRIKFKCDKCNLFFRLIKTKQQNPAASPARTHKPSAPPNNVRKRKRKAKSYGEQGRIEVEVEKLQHALGERRPHGNSSYFAGGGHRRARHFRSR